MKRHTIQRDLVLAAVRDMDNHPTAEQIYDSIASQYPGISKGTVYRNLNNLADEDQIRRVQVANAPDRFDHTVCDHAHFRCQKCGEVCDYALLHSIERENELNPGVEVSGYELVFSGICNSCKESN